MVTNYENSSFSVYQTKYDAGLHQHLIAIPPTGKTARSQQVSLAVKLGTTIGSIAFVLLSIVAVLLLRKKLRTSTGLDKITIHQRRAQNATPGNDDLEPQEIDTSDSLGQEQELPDSSRAELSDSTTPLELSVVSSHSAQELMTHHNSSRLGTASNDKHRSTGIKLIEVVTALSRDSWTTFETSAGTSCVETPKDTVQPGAVDLDRSLPPNPICESTRISPIITTVSKSSSIVRGVKLPRQYSTYVESVPGAVEHRTSSMSFTSMEMEIAIPPGTQLSEAEIVRPLTIRKCVPMVTSVQRCPKKSAAINAPVESPPLMF